MSDPIIIHCPHDFPEDLCPLCWKSIAVRLIPLISQQCAMAARACHQLKQTEDELLKTWEEIERLRADNEALRQELASLRRSRRLANAGPAEYRRLRAEAEELHAATYGERCRRFACKVCGNVPDLDGLLEHGRGCYTQSTDGGESEYVAEADLMRDDS